MQTSSQRVETIHHSVASSGRIKGTMSELDSHTGMCVAKATCKVIEYTWRLVILHSASQGSLINLGLHVIYEFFS